MPLSLRLQLKRSFKIERLPRFIFYRRDREIGRIVENPKAGLFEDMSVILAR
jgi:hypothetical protein